MLVSSILVSGSANFNESKALFKASSKTLKDRCIVYNDNTKTIIISCRSATLSDIYKQINNKNILSKQSNQNGVWILNANITIEKGSTLLIDSTDTKWLKILTDGNTLAYGIHVYGSLLIDGIKLTSWNPSTNYYALSNGSRESSGSATKICGSNCNTDQKDLLTHHGNPRPYIRVESGATGTTNITNSYIGYLGYEGGWGKKTSGIHYEGGDGSIIRNNDIDHLYFGFYSLGVGNIKIENNKVHDSGHYGIDPHTGTYDMIIRNNTVYQNNGTAIICSLNCYNITIEDNVVHDNNGAGITFSRNTTHSIAKNNYIYNQRLPIEISKSNNNEIYNNVISNSSTGGIYLKSISSYNKIYNNTISYSRGGIIIEKAIAKNNNIYHNLIKSSD